MFLKSSFKSIQKLDPSRSFSTNKLSKILYTAKARTYGGRDGNSRTDDGRLEVQLSPPGSAGKGTNPEQLFAAGNVFLFLILLLIDFFFFLSFRNQIKAILLVLVQQ